MARIIASTVLSRVLCHNHRLNKLVQSSYNTASVMGHVRNIALKRQENYTSTWQKCSIHSHARLYNKSGPEKQISSPYLDDEYEIFYSFPYMRGLRLTSRMKLVQTGLTIVAVPIVSYNFAMGTASLFQLEMLLGVATFAGIMLYVMSFYFMRVAGYLSLSREGKTLRVSHLTFWGKKRETYIPIENVVPLSDLPDKPRDAYVKLMRQDSKDIFLYTLRYGQLRNRGMFEYVFGQII